MPDDPREELLEELKERSYFVVWDLDERLP